ncbi:hypothetical protein ACFL13_01415 [Patescibacteria group bacterium]
MEVYYYSKKLGLLCHDSRNIVRDINEALGEHLPDCWSGPVIKRPTGDWKIISVKKLLDLAGIKVPAAN